MPRRPSRRVLGLLLCLILLFLGVCFIFYGPTSPAQTRYGFTWSSVYAKQLGLDPINSLDEALRELQPGHIRLPAYWSEIEKTRGKYDFTELDAQLELAKKQRIPVTLAIGSRVPRWPECWEPEWAKSLDIAERHQGQMAYVREVYQRYQNHPTIHTWQVENESFFDYYAACPGLTRALVLEEMRFVRAMENKRPAAKRRSIVTTDSGEWSLWAGFAGEVDGTGISVYRNILDANFGALHHWYFTPAFYQRRAKLFRPWAGEVFISEFQMEPWVLGPIQERSLEEQFKTLNLEQMRENFVYAKALGMPSVDFWGVEWWLWMKKAQSRPEFWEEAKKFFGDQK